MDRLLVAFNVSFDRLARSGYRKCVEFPLSVASAAGERRGAGGSGPQRIASYSPFTGQSSVVRAKRLQVHRTNRVLPNTPSPYLPWGES